MVGQIPRNLTYFVAKFGGEYEDKHPVEGGCYPLWRRHWPGNFFASTSNNPIAVGDVVLLYCFNNYLIHSDEIPGLGIAYHIDEASDKNILWYHYLKLIPSIGGNTIRSRLTLAGLLGDLNIILEAGRSPYCFLRMISNGAAYALLQGAKINWP